jgi:hypothetical protein
MLKRIVIGAAAVGVVGLLGFLALACRRAPLVSFQIRRCSMEGLTMKERLSTVVPRRDLLRAMMGGAAAAAATNAVAPEAAAAKPRTSDGKRRARYQPNSPEVQNFYRVNRYPTR